MLTDDCTTKAAFFPEMTHTANGRLVLFQKQPLPDALSDLAALAQCLCEHHSEPYGITLMHRIIRDTLMDLAVKASNNA